MKSRLTYLFVVNSLAAEQWCTCKLGEQYGVTFSTKYLAGAVRKLPRLNLSPYKILVTGIASKLSADISSMQVQEVP